MRTLITVLTLTLLSPALASASPGPTADDLMASLRDGAAWWATETLWVWGASLALAVLVAVAVSVVEKARDRSRSTPYRTRRTARRSHRLGGAASARV